MDTKSLIGIAAVTAALFCAGFLFYALFGRRKGNPLQNLLRAGHGGLGSSAADTRQRVQDDATGKEYERLKKVQKKKYKSSKQTVTLESQRQSRV